MDKKRLSKLKMPAKRPEEMELDMAEMDMDAAPSPDQEMPEELADGEMGAEMALPETAEAAPSELEMIPDEELLAELKKRGLMSQLGEEEEAGLQEGTYEA